MVECTAESHFAILRVSRNFGCAAPSVTIFAIVISVIDFVVIVYVVAISFIGDCEKV